MKQLQLGLERVPSAAIRQVVGYTGGRFYSRQPAPSHCRVGKMTFRQVGTMECVDGHGIGETPVFEHSISYRLRRRFYRLRKRLSPNYCLSIATEHEDASAQLRPRELSHTVTHPPSTTTEPASTIELRLACVSDVGMRRLSNQDSYKPLLAENLDQWNKSGHLLIVADGMGAHAAGELASRLAVDLIPHHYSKNLNLVPAEALVKAVHESNSEIFRRGQANAEFRSMGTTVSTLAILPEGAVVAHVGDSRVYRLRKQQFEQLTFDHSLVWEMVASGAVSEEAVESGSIPKNVITRSLGPNQFVDVDLEGPFPVEVGDRFLLCSDGLTGQVEDEELGILLQVLPLDQCAQVMVDLANLRGGPDNITVVLAEVAGPDLRTPEKSAARTPSRSSGQRFSPALGAAAAICVLLSAALFFLSQVPLAIVTFALGVIALITGVIQLRAWSIRSELPLDRYGRGPHRRYKIQPNEEFVSRLETTIAELREAAAENNWPLDWDKLEKYSGKCQQAQQEKDWRRAVQYYSAMVQQVMEAVRRRQRKTGEDSSIDL